jgi:CubicO group peptidase (beta-lactamase class C family)
MGSGRSLSRHGQKIPVPAKSRGAAYLVLVRRNVTASGGAIDDKGRDIARTRTQATATAIVENCTEFHHGPEVKVMCHRMRRREFLLESSRAALSFSLLPLVARAQENQKSAESVDGILEKTLIADLEKQIPRLMEEAKVPGLSIAIIKDAKLLWRRGFGLKDGTSREPVDNDTVFEAGSVSKTVFAYVAMKLCEKGVMNLDTPLTKYASARFLEGDPRLDLITARHVLSHTTGFQNWRSKEEPLKIHFTPGEKWSYSGEGYSYLQSVVTHLVGHVNPKDCAPFEAGLEVCATDIDVYLRANVLDPLGMVSSGYLWNDTMENHMAPGHDAEGKPTGLNRKPTGPAVARYAAAGGLCTTPTDYARFLIEVVDPKPSDAFRLKKETLQEMLRPQVKRNSQSSWALGWEINHTENGDFLRHGGGNPGFSCFVAASVERKAGYVIMTNSENSGYYGVIAKLITGEILSQFLGGKLRGSAE